MASLSPRDAFDRNVRLHIYQRLLTAGQAPSASATASALNASPADVEEAYQRLAEGRLIVLRPGTTEILMANPLSAVPTAFRVVVDGASHYGNCIWDALGVIAMLGGTGSVESTCGDCGEPMSVMIAQGAPVRPEGIIHIQVPAARWWDDIVFT